MKLSVPRSALAQCYLHLLWLVLPFAATHSAPAGPLTDNVPARVQVEHRADGYRLLVNGRRFQIQGAGLEFGSQEQLAAHGANSFRTWRTDNGRCPGREVLDRGWTNGLYVTMGLDVESERHGFDYNDQRAVARQLARVRTEVLKYKDHPALLLWSIGNELNLNGQNPKVWDAVNEISRMIHEVDGNHPTLTPISGMSKEVIRDLKSRAPDLDLIGVQMYADVVNLPRYLKEYGWDGPYIVTEWGATGHWEVAKTAWGAPIENDSSTKAAFYRKRFETAIKPDTQQCVGSYVFLWEQKQERTPTWYGMFLESGEETEAVDVMHQIWTGNIPTNLSPQIAGMWLDERTAQQSVRLKPATPYSARIKAKDAEGDRLTYRWEIMHESTDLKTGGDLESRPRTLPNLVRDPQAADIMLTTPGETGAYRLFVYVHDGHGHAAHANIPFFVEAKAN